MPYLAYDVRGIQSFLFAIPKLKSIIGGSALVDRFDRDTVPALARQKGWDLIHSGGGRGLFRYDGEGAADAIGAQVVKEAHAIGLDLRLGRATNLIDATHCAEALYPYLPEQADGHPCSLSGLYPVARPGDVHPIVRKREFDHGDHMDRWFESVVLDGRDGKSPLAVHPALQREPVFFREVQADGERGRGWGAAGLEALGGRPRWAIICMDGNDIGRQFAAISKSSLPEAEMLDWVRRAGQAIDDCGTTAFRKATERVLREWVGDVGHDNLPVCDGKVVLPLRPLVLGGDDLALLCHPRYAASFVLEACRVFAATSKERAAKSKTPLWPAAKHGLSISAGILYAPSSLPLATAIPYAESLLALAKQAGRRVAADAPPACVDWESITESMLDRPEFRRQRELVFRDGDLGEEVRLTQRPMALDAFEALLRDAKQLADKPVSVLHKLRDGLRAPAYERQVFVNRLRKNHGDLAEALREPDPDAKKGKSGFGARWRTGPGFRATDLLDLVGLILEERRQGKEVTSW
jgi:hypothetical protein